MQKYSRPTEDVPGRDLFRGTYKFYIHECIVVLMKFENIIAITTISLNFANLKIVPKC
jgi:hypothetical protein